MVTLAATRNVSDLLSAGFSLEYQDMRACFALRAPPIPTPISDPSTSQQDRSGSILHNSLLSLKTGVDDTGVEAARQPIDAQPSLLAAVLSMQRQRADRATGRSGASCFWFLGCSNCGIIGGMAVKHPPIPTEKMR